MAKEIHIYGSIGYDWWTGEGITAKWFINELNAIKASGEKDVNVRINSPGGDVFEGIAIYNAILNSDLNINTIIDGIAYSMGAIIALAGKKVKVAKTGTLLLHNASGFAYGNANDMRGTVELMDKLDNSLAISVADKTGLSLDDVKAKYFDYRDHTLTAQEALDAKLVDEIIDSSKVEPKSFKNSIEAMAFFNTESQKSFIKNEVAASILKAQQPEQLFV